MNSRSGSSVTTDRNVRFTVEFFNRLEMLLPEDRSEEGMLSATDFLLFDLPPIRDKLAHSFETETLSTGDDGIRVYVGHGVLVKSVALYARIDGSGSVEVFWVSLEIA